MDDERRDGRGNEQGDHPLERDAGLPPLDREVARHGHELRQGPNVRDEQGEVADGERPGAEAPRRDEKDEPSAQGGGVPEERVQRLGEQAVADGSVQPLTREPGHVVDDALPRVGELDRGRGLDGLARGQVDDAAAFA